MLIRTQLRLAAVLPAVFALLIGSVLWVTAHQIRQAQLDAGIAVQARVANFELNILTQEYLLYGGARAESQLQLRHRSMGELLSRLSFDTEEERELIEALKRGHAELGSIHELLLKGKPAARDQMIGALLVKAQDIRAKAEELANIQYRRVSGLQHRSDMIVIGAIIALVGVSVLLLTLLAKRLIGGIDQLDHGVRLVAAGDLEHPVELPIRDELGELASSFNSMRDRLRDSYISIETLKAEVARRVEAETKVHQLNADLEVRVVRRTADFEASNKELEAFAYSVSHDLRAPLRAIDGFSHKVVINYGGMLDDEGRRLLQVVRDNALRMGRLIDDLLGFSRMGRREMALQALDMAAMVRGVIEELHALEPQREIDFVLGALPPAEGDAAMLRQVWFNLVDNAMKFTRNCPRPRIEVGGRAEGGELVYWISDNGAGFDMRYAEKLFGVFQRLHRQDEFEGTGVGLALAQRILVRHRGRICGEGTPGAGATFHFALPLPATIDPLLGA